MSTKHDPMVSETNARMQPSENLYHRPKSREEMVAPLAWHEEQLAVVRRYGVMADGSIGFEVVRAFVKGGAK